MACEEPSVPEVDNSTLECDDIISTQCIITEEANAFMQYGKGVTLTSVLEIISAKVYQMYNSLLDYLPAYKVHTIALLQTGTNIPSAATVLDNRLSITPVYTRTSVGEYILTATGAFTSGKTVIIAPQSRTVFTAGVETTIDKFYVERIDDDSVSIKTAQKNGAVTTLADGLLDGINTVLEIRVYK